MIFFFRICQNTLIKQSVKLDLTAFISNSFLKFMWKYLFNTVFAHVLTHEGIFSSKHIYSNTISNSKQ